MLQNLLKSPKEKLQEILKLTQKRSAIFDIVLNLTPIEISLEENKI